MLTTFKSLLTTKNLPLKLENWTDFDPRLKYNKGGFNIQICIPDNDLNPYQCYPAQFNLFNMVSLSAVTLYVLL
jgi:hypothetical protein